MKMLFFSLLLTYSLLSLNFSKELNDPSLHLLYFLFNNFPYLCFIFLLFHLIFQSMQNDNQEWIVVKSKRKSKQIEKLPKPQKIFFKGGNTIYDKQAYSTMEQQFLNNTNISSNTKIINNFISKASYKQIHINCLGIGNFSSYLKPQLQMQFMKYCIIKQLEQALVSFTVNIYDPIFTQQQKEQIKTLKATCVQLKNIQQNRTHFVYMPHCDRFLYQNLCELALEAKNCEVIVIGNSINEYKQRCLLIGSEIPKVFECLSPKEIKIQDYKQAFNDTFIYKL